MNIMQAKNLSLITKVNVPVVVETPSIWEILNVIRTGEPLLDQYPFIGTVKKIRTLLNENGQQKDEKIKALKLSLPKLFPHVIIEKGGRIGESSGVFSGFVHFDIDAIKPEDIKIVAETLQSLNPYCLFKSPSNLGYKVFFQTDLEGSTKGQDKVFKGIWQAIGNQVNDALSKVSNAYKIDDSQKAITSGLFMSFDPDIWVNPNPSIIKIDELDLSEEKEAKVSSKVQQKAQSKIIGKSINWVGKYPEREEILKHLEWMNTSKQETAIDAIIDYFKTNRGEGKRYHQFFRMASILCTLGRSNEIQEWSTETFRDVLILLDYDGSRKEKDQIEGSLDSLKKYGYFESQVQVKKDAYTQHLKSFVQPQKILKAKSFVSECHSELLNEISSNIRLAVDSPTGSGKTAWIFKKLINDFQGRILFALPLRSLLSELQSKYRGDERVQFLSDGQKIDPTKKLICCTYEKLLSYQKDLQTSDLLVIDEAHLLGQSFRSNTFRQLVNLASKKTSKFILLSATMQSFLSALKPHLDIRYVKIETETPQQKISIKITDAKDIISFGIDYVSNILEQNPDEKILVFKNDKSMLFELQTQLKAKGIDALLVTRDTTRTDEEVQLLWEGKVPKAQIILSTQVSEIGVSLPFIQRTIILGKQYSSEQIVQTANRTRSPNTIVEWILQKERKQQQACFTECFSSEYQNEYKEDAEEWVNIEKRRFKLLFPKGSLKQASMEQDYIKALDNTINGGDESHRFKGICQVVRNEVGTYTLDLNVQGWVQNLCSIERQNEAKLEYVIQKLKTLWNIETEVSHSKSMVKKQTKRKIDVDVWQLLRACISYSENLLSDVEEVLQKNNVNPFVIIETLKQVETRAEKLNTYNLSWIDYLFVSDLDFNRVMDWALINYNPAELHPIEQALAQAVKDQGLVGKIVCQDQIVQLIDNLVIPSEAKHLHEVVKSFTPNGKSRWFRKLIQGQKTRKLNPSVGKKERALLIEGIAWENLKVYHQSNWEIHPYYEQSS
jgi:hypothetical protein